MLIYDANFEWMYWWFDSALTLILACSIELILSSVIGLLAIWGGLGRPHWFIRAVVLMVGLTWWLVVPAYEPMLVFAIQTALVVLLLAWVGRRQAMTRESTTDSAKVGRFPQFALRDLLLWSVVVAVASAAAAQVPFEVWVSWWKYLLVGTGYGVLTLLAAWVALGRYRWWVRAIVGCLGFPSLLVVGWLLLGRASGMLGRDPPDRATFRYAARIGLVLVSLLMVLPIALVYYKLVAPTPIPVTTLPKPNGYDDLTRAGEAFNNITIPDRESRVFTLRAFVQKNTPTLRIARTGLDRACQVPVRYDTDDLSICNFSSIRSLARAFHAEGLLAEEEGRMVDAMQSHCNNLRLGYATARGGLWIDRLVGMAIMGIGLEGLNDLGTGLSPRQCRELIEILETPEPGWEPKEDCWARERAWQDHAFGWRGRIWGLIHSLSGDGENIANRMEDVDLRNEAQRRLLIGSLAIRCYQLEQGALPDTLADLVPEHLPEIPEDPFSGESLIYRRTGNEPVLYSVGQNRLDDVGHRVDPKETSGDDKDLFLNIPFDRSEPDGSK